jgi:predicted transcriptional regulator
LRGGGGPGSLIEATVTVTGLTRAEVFADLKAGQTLTQIAESKGKTAADVIAAAHTELDTRLKQAVTDGKLTQADADAKLKAFDDSASATMTSTTLGQMPQGGPGFGHDGFGGGPGELIEATVSVTGLAHDEVFTDLKAGQSLAQIAVSKGKTADEVIVAARTQLQDSLKQAVTDGKLTQAQADSALADFDKTATETVNSTTLGTTGPGLGGPGFGHDGMGRGGGAGSLIESTVTVTGLTRAEVFTDLKAGQTLTQIAESKGKTAADVIAAARTALDTQLKQAVTDGKLTQAEAEAKLKAFDDSASATMTSTTLGQMMGQPHFGPHNDQGGDGQLPTLPQPSGTTVPTGGSGA